MPNVVFLYTRMPGYFLNCIRYFIQHHPTYSAYCVCYKPSLDAPFQFSSEERLILKQIDALTEGVESWIDTLAPDLIFAAGWGNKQYMRICRKYRKKIPVVVGMDNVWTGSLKQRLFSIVSPYYLPFFFSHIWVPGSRQVEYAKKLGFREHNIRTGLYCAESIFFLSEHQMNTRTYDNNEILFAGRLVGFKRPDMLLKVFLQLRDEGEAKKWRLKFIGNGPLKDSLEEVIKKHQADAVQIVDFLQPSLLKNAFLSATFFCLPSSGEHWGVVVQEAACMGLPVLVSDTCGSFPDLVESGKTGLVFRDGCEESLKTALRQLMAASPEMLGRMGQESRSLASGFTPAYWSESILYFLSNKEV